MSERIYKETNSGKVIPQEKLVRCRDCKYVETNRCPMYRAHFGYTDDDFCSIGESYAEDIEQERSEMGVK